MEPKPEEETPVTTPAEEKEENKMTEEQIAQ